MDAYFEPGTYVTGTKQVLRAIEEGRLERAVIAQDAEEHLRLKLQNACQKADVLFDTVPTMKELGTACGIEVGAAVAGVLKNQ